MANIELVIKIPEEYYKAIIEIPVKQSTADMLIIRYGTPLPKGHGDLIDVNRKITVPIYDDQYEEWGEKTMTVREVLNKWSDEGITVKDVVISADKTGGEDRE